ncbi:hypothetical protein JL720_11780 [Aureococcus anophagefferens]|nr:hypothetical protein JL720_11780 [Aureococcus anophagefferens]
MERAVGKDGTPSRAAATKEEPVRRGFRVFSDATPADAAWAALLLAIASFLAAAHERRLLAGSVAFATVAASLAAPFHIYFKRRHQPHRLLGLSYLVQWTYALVMYFADYAALRDGVVMYTLPLTGAPPRPEPRRAIATPTPTPAGFAQAVVATRTFWFLPKKQRDPGYYTDKSTMSWSFIAENQYFAGLLLFQCVYMTGRARALLAGSAAGNAVEAVMVALPYVVVRPCFPKTSFRDSLRGGDGRKGNVSARNATFFRVQTWVTKTFYVFAKHFIGYFLNYARFLDRLDAAEIRHVHLMLVFSCFATTISMFLHTLKFKGYMGPRTAFLVYQASYLATFYSWYKLAPTVAKSPDLVAATLAGVAVNFMGRNAIRAYQAAVAVALFARRAGAV